LELRAGGLFGSQLVDEAGRLLLLVLATGFELHVDAGEDLDYRLADAAEGHGELWFEEEVEHDLLSREDLSDAEAEGDVVRGLLDVEVPNRR
jgi:hypothetical protein